MALSWIVRCAFHSREPVQHPGLRSGGGKARAADSADFVCARRRRTRGLRPRKRGMTRVPRPDDPANGLYHVTARGNRPPALASSITRLSGERFLKLLEASWIEMRGWRLPTRYCLPCPTTTTCSFETPHPDIAVRHGSNLNSSFAHWFNTSATNVTGAPVRAPLPLRASSRREEQFLETRCAT